MTKKNHCNYYDDPEFDYQNYWIGRNYEDQVERKVLDFFYNLIGRSSVIVDLGGGYGRLVECYCHNADKVVLVEPSSKNLKEAKKLTSKWKNLKLKKGMAENLDLASESVDVVQMIRVAHHCKDLPKVFKRVRRVLKPGGWFILEFANKIHLLMTLKNYLKGNLAFRKEINSIDRRADVNKTKEVVPFMNHHPVQVLNELKTCGFTINKTLSVSNLRRINWLPVNLRVYLDKWMWGLTKGIWWGPSIFVLARKIKQ
jgi:ubiquinone/menaquinone biosynthesis C-methylase UbiE